VCGNESQQRKASGPKSTRLEAPGQVYGRSNAFETRSWKNFHAGITPYSQAGDYSGVFVKTLAGEIPWSKLSRLSDEEMKTLMIDVVNRTYLLLQTLFDEDVGSYLIHTLSQQDLVPFESK
jgi:hypothetical protein